jgi:hypothetical protein
MKKFLLAAAALALGVQGAMAEPAKEGWYKLIKPILECSSDPCETLPAGTVFYFDQDDQGNMAGLIVLWRMPDMTEVMVTPGDWGRAGPSSFKRTHAPKGW